MAPDAPLWQIALGAALSVLIGQYLVKWRNNTKKTGSFDRFGPLPPGTKSLTGVLGGENSGERGTGRIAKQPRNRLGKRPTLR